MRRLHMLTVENFNAFNVYIAMRTAQTLQHTSETVLSTFEIIWQQVLYSAIAMTSFSLAVHLE